MPPHTPRQSVIGAAQQAQSAGADLIVTVGGGSITDGAKAVQLCLANNIQGVDDIDRIRANKGVAPDMNAPLLTTPIRLQINFRSWLLRWIE
jgi:maleylacetate reductase